MKHTSKSSRPPRTLFRLLFLSIKLEAHSSTSCALHSKTGLTPDFHAVTQSNAATLKQLVLQQDTFSNSYPRGLADTRRFPPRAHAE